MEILNFSQDPDLEKVGVALQEGAIVVDLNHVFAVVALPNVKGADALSRVKNRKAGKCYGSLISDAHQFVNGSKLDAETAFKLTTCMAQGILDDAFVRIPWGDAKDSPLIMNGTHQGLKTTDPILSFCRLIEQRLVQPAEDFIVPHLICSSANISGDPRGSITDRSAAIQFGLDRSVGLFVEFDFPNRDVESGSFPIFSFEHMAFAVERTGPRCAEIHRMLLQSGFSTKR